MQEKGFIIENGVLIKYTGVKKSVTIPDNITNIGAYAFSSCNLLTSVVIPDGVTSIDKNAFKYCYSLTDVIIPNSVTSIGEEAFYNCRSLTKVNYTGTIDEWVQIEFDNYSSNPLYCAKYNLTPKQVLGNMRNKKQYIGEFYDPLLTDKENVDIMKEYGLDISIITLKRWKKENNINYNNTIHHCKYSNATM